MRASTTKNGLTLRLLPELAERLWIDLQKTTKGMLGFRFSGDFRSRVAARLQRRAKTGGCRIWFLSECSLATSPFSRRRRAFAKNSLGRYSLEPPNAYRYKITRYAIRALEPLAGRENGVEVEVAPKPEHETSVSSIAPPPRARLLTASFHT